jgi:protein-tyrosine kinase
LGKIFSALEKINNEKLSVVQDQKPQKEERENKDIFLLDKIGVPNLQNQYKIDKNLVALKAPQSLEAEQFKILRTNLLFPFSGEPPRSIMVSSFLPGEGKSFTSANLAVSIAQNIDQNVLLIDCDLRKPSIQSMFGFDDCIGLSEYLLKDVSLSSIIYKTNIERLSIIPGGHVPENPSELLSCKEMSDLIIEVKERYADRIVLIDSPPLKLTPEAIVLSRLVDGIVLVIKCGSTDRDLVSGMVDSIEKDKILGVVFNHCNKKAMPYYGYGKNKKTKKK